MNIKAYKTEFRKFLNDKDKIIENGISRLLDIKNSILNKDKKVLRNKIERFSEYTKSLWDFHQKYYELTESDLCESINYLRDNHNELPISEKEVDKQWFGVLKKLFKSLFQNKEKQIYPQTSYRKESDEIIKENNKRSSARDILFGPLYALKEYAIPSLEWCLKVFELIDQNELHISGEAGMGKTHISFNIYEDQIINQKQPALFVFAKDINTNQHLENQLKDNFNVPTDLSFDDFLDVLEIAAKVNNAKMPIIIDGLNESAYWYSVWENGLENLIIKIKQKYPHLVLVTTYRTSYEDQLFPDKYFDYKNNKDWWKLKENVRGFEGLTWNAIESYFKFYRIKLENRSDAIGYFKHPLHLKIFCEAKNPERRNEVKVSFQNEDLFEVFDEYIKNSNRNIANTLKKLDSKYDDNFTEKKLLKLSEYIWKNNSRGMPRSENLFTNDELRVFEGENLLIFMDWNIQENKEEIQFTYDLMGGYLASKYLIKTYEESYPIIKINTNSMFANAIKTGVRIFIPERGTKQLERFLANTNKKLGRKKPLLRFAKSREFRKNLLDKRTEHPLFDDILRTICILFIKKNDIFLFDILKNDRAKKYSTESLFEINAEYIKKNEKLIKSFLKTEFLKNNKTYLLNLAENVELDINHPLNFNLWSDLLSSLSMSEKDLSWSEYIRKNHSWYGHSHFSDLVNHFEEACKREGDLSNRVHFAAKKVMWVLITNIRKLRDEATRALYYYARKYPKEFLELLKYSLDINDPYVPERMLAVSYGLAMARQNDFKDNSYKKEWLPQYGKFLFENIFSENAKYTTTHILARDYAKRTIDIALLHHPKLLTTNEKSLTRYPLKKYPQQNWDEDTDKNKGEYRDGNAPIHMDFENYTIRRLIEDRRNYDSEHNEYKQVLSQIYWRIYHLGYSLEDYGEIDKQIARESWNHSQHENSGITDRYGKKYSWIAFYEMAGHRSDLGLLKGWDDEDGFRISDTDIDPSFPIELRQYDLFKDLTNSSFLGDENKSPESWYEVDNDLDINEYIHTKNNFGGKEEYEWILLKGNISQKNKDDQTRDVHISINAVFVNDDDFKKIEDIINKHDDYTFEYLRNTEDHYLFEGEIPWCDLMPEDDSQNFRLSYNYRNIEKSKKELKIINNGKELTENEVSDLKERRNEYLQESLEKVSNGEFAIKLPFLFDTHQDNDITKKIAKKMGYTATYIDVPYVEKENDVLETNVDTAVFQNSWESYHSEIIPSGETQVPSKEICEYLGLFINPQSSDLCDNNGEVVSTSFKYGKGYDRTSIFTYLRKDYLDNYLRDKNKKVLWLQWAEKRYFPNGVKKLGYRGEREKAEYRTYYKIIK